MALIPDDPNQRNRLFIAIGLLALIYPFHAFWYSGQREEVDAMQARFETLDDQNRRAQILAARGGGEIDETLLLYERHVARLEELIPGLEEVAGLVDDISEQSRIYDVEQNRIVPEPLEQGAVYDLKAYEIAAIGEYHDIGRYLTAIASQSRIVRPVELDMVLFDRPELFPEYEYPVLATFRIETYVLPDPAAAPPPADPAQGGGA